MTYLGFTTCCWPDLSPHSNYRLVLLRIAATRQASDNKINAAQDKSIGYCCPQRKYCYIKMIHSAFIDETDKIKLRTADTLQSNYLKRIQSM